MNLDQYIATNRNKINASALAGSSLISQLLFMASISIIARDYGKAILGSFFLVYSIQTVGTALLSLRFDALILHEKNIKSATEGYQVGVAINLAVLIVLIVWQLSKWGIHSVVGHVVMEDLIIGAEYACLGTIYILGCSYLSRWGVFRHQTMSRICGAAVFIALISMAPDKSDKTVKIAFAISLIAQNIILFLNSKLALGSLGKLHQYIYSKRIRSKIRYGLCVLVPASFMDTFSQQFPVYILTGTLGLPSVALYSVCQRIAQFPISLLAPGVISTYGPRLAGTNEKETLFKENTKKMIAAAAPTYVLMWILGPKLLTVMSVNDLNQGGDVIGALSVNGFIILASTLVSPTLLSLGVKYAPIICASSALLYRPVAFMLGLKLFGTLAAACFACTIAEATQIAITTRFTCNELSLVSLKKKKSIRA